MKTVFADAFYYLALLAADDEAHDRAVDLTLALRARMVTTTWVLTEVADGLAKTRNRKLFNKLIDRLRNDPTVIIVPPSLVLFDASAALYRRRADKEWSLTDCVSFVVMERKHITEALTGDHHFEQAGFVALLK